MPFAGLTDNALLAEFNEVSAPTTEKAYGDPCIVAMDRIVTTLSHLDSVLTQLVPLLQGKVMPVQESAVSKCAGQNISTQTELPNPWEVSTKCIECIIPVTHIDSETLSVKCVH